MGSTVAGVLFVGSLLVALVVCHRYLGDYMARVYSDKKHFGLEKVIYRAAGVNPDSEQSWGRYLRSLLAFSVISILGLYAMLRLQNHLPWAVGMKPMEESQAFNTAVSFTTNTNWQSYSGESTVGYLTQMAGLAVQNFVSAAVGMAVAVALVRGFARSRSETIGNFWVDLTRTCVRILLPIAVVGATLLVANGVVQNLDDLRTVVTPSGFTQTIMGGGVASQEVIKDLGTNGGGFFNANSSHPFENPNPFTNWLEIFLLLVIPFALPRTFGTLIGDRRQGRAIAIAMGVIALASVSLAIGFEASHNGTVPDSVQASVEGKETRFGVPNSATFAAATTLTSTGSVNSFHDSYTSFGGAVPMVNMLLGEVAPGGVGAGLYGMLVLAVLTVFVAGLMVGRTPEYVRKKIGARQMKLVALYILTMPALVLAGIATAMALPGQRATMLNDGAHGFSEVIYAFASAANNNGSAFAGLGVNTTWWNTVLGLVMLLGRFLPIVFVLALAGSLARQQPVPESEGTLPTHRTLYVGMLVGVTLIVVGLTFFPALALGPIAEGLN